MMRLKAVGSLRISRKDYKQSPLGRTKTFNLSTSVSFLTTNVAWNRVELHSVQSGVEPPDGKLEATSHEKRVTRQSGITFGYAVIQAQSLLIG